MLLFKYKRVNDTVSIDIPGAIEDYSKVIKLDSNDEWGYNNRGMQNSNSKIVIGSFS